MAVSESVGPGVDRVRPRAGDAGQVPAAPGARRIPACGLPAERPGGQAERVHRGDRRPRDHPPAVHDRAAPVDPDVRPPRGLGGGPRAHGAVHRSADVGGDRRRRPRDRSAGLSGDRRGARPRPGSVLLEHGLRRQGAGGPRGPADTPWPDRPGGPGHPGPGGCGVPGHGHRRQAEPVGTAPARAAAAASSAAGADGACRPWRAARPLRRGGGHRRCGRVRGRGAQGRPRGAGRRIHARRHHEVRGAQSRHGRVQGPVPGRLLRQHRPGCPVECGRPSRSAACSCWPSR